MYRRSSSCSDPGCPWPPLGEQIRIFAPTPPRGEVSGSENGFWRIPVAAIPSTMLFIDLHDFFPLQSPSPAPQDLLIKMVVFLTFCKCCTSENNATLQVMNAGATVA